ncbi:MAG: class I SAM-dependent DNA methyltransferase [Polyangiales bacterium]
MARTAKAASSAPDNFEQTLWSLADKLRNNLDAAEYKHVVLGLIFLKYISESFEARHAQLTRETDDPKSDNHGADPEDPDEYRSVNVFWVPPDGRWSAIHKLARQGNLGRRIDEAMLAIERENEPLKGVLPKEYARRHIDAESLAGLVDLVDKIGFGDERARSLDVLGRVYEYFLGQFAAAEGKKGGQFYTAACVVELLVAMLAPQKKSRVYDPCCGSGGMFVQSERFVAQRRAALGDISVYGQESNPTTWRLARMNLAIRGIDADLGPRAANTFHNDLHPDLKADYILANPPFNDSDWGGDRLRDDARWSGFVAPPVSNANYAWILHFVHHLAPSGMAGFVMANGSMSTMQSGEGDIRRQLIDRDLIDCMVALPGQLFFNTQIPVCLWFLARNKKDRRFRDRREQTLFIDARKMGSLVDRTHRVLSHDDVAKIAGAYHAWRGDTGAARYEDVAGFCKSATKAEVLSHDGVLTPGRYVGNAVVEESDGEPFKAKYARLTATLKQQFAEGRRLEEEIERQLARVES